MDLNSTRSKHRTKKGCHSIPQAPLGSLFPPAPPWSGVDHPAPRDSTPLASPRPSGILTPSGSFIPSAPSQSSVALAPPWPPGSTSPHWSPAPSAPPRTSGSFPSPWLFVSPSLPQAPPPLAPLLLVGPLESAAILLPWLLPPSAPPWVDIMAVAWAQLDSSCSKSLLSAPWLLLQFSSLWTSLPFSSLLFYGASNFTSLDLFRCVPWNYFAGFHYHVFRIPC
ncbi:proline-rich protein 36-like isoform X1 [Carassius auratus]|uniref:Proline-rich protein 36-like isoform X1 n=1 Tax=Carassius auratus TaxID=7957 RepID=A0A6P6QAH9_CARAU|nr:proline-rich protein 36-like isoform X1 [Carassius auratus]